ncbi:MAG: CpXC domain-containing protein [Clostridia bacterium]|nr:CpXC domain-containing protein [Clostridia bacterium]
MSLEKKEMMECPYCKKLGEFTKWESINTVLNPDAKAALISGELFAFKCPHCEKVSPVSYELLYHDMPKQLMIHFVMSEKSAEEAMKSFKEMTEGKLSKLPQLSQAKFTFRIVSSMNELREKAFVFDMNLDDRVIELMKVMLVTQLRNEVPDKLPFNIYLDLRNNEPETFLVEYTDGTWGNINVPHGTYNRVKDMFIKPQDDGRNEYFVNGKWAFDFLQKNLPQE